MCMYVVPLVYSTVYMFKKVVKVRYVAPVFARRTLVVNGFVWYIIGLEVF